MSQATRKLKLKVWCYESTEILAEVFHARLYSELITPRAANQGVNKAEWSARTGSQFR
jgi:hypothetical protein